jgi:hypothetical protein
MQNSNGLPEYEIKEGEPEKTFLEKHPIIKWLALLLMLIVIAYVLDIAGFAQIINGVFK